jgi:PKD repeat protein
LPKVAVATGQAAPGYYIELRVATAYGSWVAGSETPASIITMLGNIRTATGSSFNLFGIVKDIQTNTESLGGGYTLDSFLTAAASASGGQVIPDLNLDDYTNDQGAGAHAYCDPHNPTSCGPKFFYSVSAELLSLSAISGSSSKTLFLESWDTFYRETNGQGPYGSGFTPGGATQRQAVFQNLTNQGWQHIIIHQLGPTYYSDPGNTWGQATNVQSVSGSPYDQPNTPMMTPVPSGEYQLAHFDRQNKNGSVETSLQVFLKDLTATQRATGLTNMAVLQATDSYTFVYPVITYTKFDNVKYFWDASVNQTASSTSFLSFIESLMRQYPNTPPSPLTASVSASPTSGPAPLSVTFTSTVSGGTGPYTYSWKFGDGAVSSVANPIHSYSSSGVYTARLTVKDFNGLKALASQQVNVTGTAPPNPVLTSITASTRVGFVSLNVNFGSTTTGGTPSYAYSWHFGDGGTASTASPSHTFATTGFFNSTLTVTDTKGLNATASVGITVVPTSAHIETVILKTSPTNLANALTIDGAIISTTTTFQFVSGSTHNFTASSSAAPYFRFSSWSDAGAITHAVVTSTNTTYTATYTATTGIVQMFSNSGTGSTLTCAFTQPVAQYDVIFVVAGGDNFIHTVTDTFANSYTSQVSTSIINNTIHSFSNITTASQAHAAGADTVTVTFRASAHGSVVCYDTTGVSGTKAHSSTGTGGWSSKSASYPSVVGSYSPTLGNFELSVMEGAACTSASTPSFPTVAAPQTNTNYGSAGGTGSPLVNTGTSCGTPGNFYNFLGSSYVLSSLGLATTENWLVTSPAAPTSNTANIAEVAADFTAKTTLATGLSEAVSLTGVAQIRNVVDSEVNGLLAFTRLIPPSLSQPEALFTKYALAQQNNVEKECLGVAITVNSVQTLNTGPLCQVTSVTSLVYTAACNFYQLQCWAYPLLFMGLYVSFFLGAAIAFSFTEKGLLYFVLAGATYASLIELSLGIMTPFVPVALIALNVAYSFRLDRLVTGNL